MMSTVLRWKKCSFVILLAGRPACIQRRQSEGQSIVVEVCFSQNLSVHQKSPWSALLWQLLWHSVQVLRCFLSARHIPSAWTFRRDQEEQQEEVSKGHCCSYTTFSSLTLCIAVLMCLQGKHNIQTQNNSPAVGKSVLRNNLVGGCFFLD